VQTETIAFFLGNKIKFSSAVLTFGSRSMVALHVVNEHHAYSDLQRLGPVD